MKRILFFLSTLLLTSCGSSRCGFKTLTCNAMTDRIIMSEEERYEASDLYYVLTFDSYQSKTYVYGCDHYYTKYNVTINQKIKGDVDISTVLIMIDFNSCVTGAGAEKERVELGHKYYIFLKWFEPFKGYETTEKMASIKEYDYD